MKESYDSIAEAIRDMLVEFPDSTHFLINPEDAGDMDVPEQVDDLTGAVCYVVDGYKVFVSEECPPGTIGAHNPNDSDEGEIEIAPAMPTNKIGQA